MTATGLNREKSGRKRLWGGLLFSINLVFALLLLASQAVTSISPAKFWPLEVLANSYPFLLVFNLLFLIIWALKKHRFFFLSASIILMGYDKLSQLYQPAMLVMDVRPPKGAIKVMSYNVRLFDLYNWTGNLKTRSKIFDLLSSENPDILCLQEYFHSDVGDFQNNEPIKKLLSVNYSSIKYGLTLRKTNHWGIATFSRFPIINEGTVFFEPEKTNFCLYSDIVFKEDTVRVYNVHLQSNHFKEHDYKFLENPDQGNNDEIVKGTKSILQRIRSAVVRRSEQVDELKAHIAACPYPVLVCGDFNDPPFSYAYQTLKKDLKDAYTEKGEGFGNTYFGFPIKFRIDFILHSTAIKTHTFQTKRIKLSDHYPIESWISLP